MAAHPGQRKIGGRKPNTPNKFSSARAERAAKEGPLPPDNLLAIARHAMAMAMRYRLTADNPEADKTEHKAWMQIALDANNKAAPYFSPRMSAMHITHKHLDLSQLSDDELTAIEAVIERASEPGSGADRTGETHH